MSEVIPVGQAFGRALIEGNRANDAQASGGKTVAFSQMFGRLTDHRADIPPRDGLPPPLRYWAVSAIGLGVTMAVLDGAIANVALPTIARDLNAQAASAIWVVNAYQLAVTVALLPLGALADLIGHRRVFLAGMVLFTIASLACAAADSLFALSLSRMVQGLGGAGIMSVNGAMIRIVYPRARLGRGIGLNAVIVALSAALGPTLASAILSVGAWRWLFAINLPIGIAAFTLGMRTLPASIPGTHRFDFWSAVLSALMFGLFIVGVDGLGHAERATLVGAAFAISLGSGAALIIRELKDPAPLLPIDLMRIPLFALSVATSICSFVAQMLAYVVLPFFLESRHGFTDVETGLLMTPWPLAILIVAPIAGRLADRVPAGLLGGVGLAVFAVGLGLLALLPADARLMGIVWRMAVAGAGFGLFQTPNNRALIGSAPKPRAGGASGMLATARVVGQTLGAALVALIFARTQGGGMQLALLLAAGTALLAAIVSLLRHGQPEPMPD